MQLGDHAGTHKRGLAAARSSNHRQEAVRSQQLQQRGGLLLAAKEQMVLVAAKRAEAGKWIGTLGIGGHAAASFAWRMARAKSASKPGSKASLVCRITLAETLLKRSLRWLKGGPTKIALTGIGCES